MPTIIKNVTSAPFFSCFTSFETSRTSPTNACGTNASKADISADSAIFTSSGDRFVSSAGIFFVYVSSFPFALSTKKEGSFCSTSSPLARTVNVGAESTSSTESSSDRFSGTSGGAVGVGRSLSSFCSGTDSTSTIMSSTSTTMGFRGDATWGTTEFNVPSSSKTSGI